MTEILTTVEVNCETGEAIYRNLTAEEVVNFQERVAAVEARRVAAEAEAASVAAAKESANAKLAALGLSPEEIAAL